MTELLEIELRQVFIERANAVPPDIAERLRRIDYRRRHHLRAFRAVAFAACAAAAVVVVALVVGAAGPTARGAFAAWTAEPTSASTSAIAAAQANCAGSLGLLGHIFFPGTTPVWQTPVADTRGPFVLLVQTSGGHYSACFTNASVNPSPVTGGGAGQIPTAALAPGAIELVGFGTHEWQDASYEDIEGRVASDVSAVTLTLGDRMRVVASVSGGWMAAWWPTTQKGSSCLLSAEVSSSSGTANQQIHAGPTNSGCR
jgi:predicted anti-sigma-YlaC factor YlaD